MLKNGRKLKKSVKFANVFFKKDLTRKQQEAEYRLRKEREERIAKGEDVIIFNEKVILRNEHPNYDPSKQRNFEKTKDQNHTKETI